MKGADTVYVADPPPQELQLVAVQDEQLPVPADWTVPSELPKAQTEIKRLTSAVSHPGQWTAASRRITSFSNLRSQAWQ